jgi:hypothetical protein
MRCTAIKEVKVFRIKDSITSKDVLVEHDGQQLFHEEPDQ